LALDLLIEFDPSETLPVSAAIGQISWKESLLATQLNGDGHEILTALYGQEAQQINSFVRPCYDGYFRLRPKDPGANHDASV
jgi:hypothetical protein